MKSAVHGCLLVFLVIVSAVILNCGNEKKKEILLSAAREAPVGGESITVYSDSTLEIRPFALRDRIRTTGKVLVKNDTLYFQYDSIPGSLFSEIAIVQGKTLTFLPSRRWMDLGKNNLVRDLASAKGAAPHLGIDYRDFWNRIEGAFFSKDGKKNLRLLRNEIYAHHGREFESADLREHFSNLSWYHPDSGYSDSLIKGDAEILVREISQLEAFLDTMPDSLRTLYDEEITFRRIPYKDTLIVTDIDYTGDGFNERQFTKIVKDDDDFSVFISILSQGDTDTLWTWAETTGVGFAPQGFPVSDLGSNWRLLIKLAPPTPLRKAYDDWPDYVYGLMATDVAKITGKAKEDVLENVKEYVKSFEGELFYSTTGESGGCGYIWYAPLKTFVTFYCP